MSLLNDKYILVTGGAGFIGKSFCRSILKEGGVPLISELHYSDAQKTEQELLTEFPKGQVLSLEIDITSPESIASAFLRIKEEVPRLDAVVNNAYPRGGRYGLGPEEISTAEFNHHLTSHLGGYFNCCQEAIGYFRTQGYGNIINMSSIYGFLTPRFQVYRGTEMTTPLEYAVVKAGILQMTRYFARYLKGCSIRVNALSPGGVLQAQPQSFLKEYKEFCSEKGMLDPTDLSGGLIFLLSDQSSTMTGQNLVIDDGFSL